jgi:hypothetical protein
MGAGVALLVGPEIERQGDQIVYCGDGVSIFAQINALDIGLAGIATLDADLLKFFCGKYRQFVLVLLTAIGAEHTAKLPLCGAE